MFVESGRCRDDNGLTDMNFSYTTQYGGIDPFIMYSKKKLLADSHIGQDLRKEMEQVWNEANGKKWNASVARFHQRKVLPQETYI